MATTTRLDRAQRLLDLGHVTPDGNGVLFYVRSESDPSVTYPVEVYPNGDNVCRCIDFGIRQDRAGGSHKVACKHVAAAMLWLSRRYAALAAA